MDNAEQNQKKKEIEVKRGPGGDARPDYPGVDPRTGGSLPQEDVKNRPNVSTVTPKDYPLTGWARDSCSQIIRLCDTATIATAAQQSFPL